jgi:hypothetical protein
MKIIDSVFEPLLITVSKAEFKMRGSEVVLQVKSTKQTTLGISVFRPFPELSALSLQSRGRVIG